ncbi:single-stranded-DNA-specific exonuclease RecJ [Cohaesibacter celericrescens]|uniref:Single-stranded-DNA-specific exonuclease RecJ n=1 Tax=Cohaesibacter celericrescens TaxID=2067669 RepID=A0A2N5XVY4_9HYPH|nr:single-stranded-DNA-specific exonuclease RecJ [Cohaesibacter celericrescens]PLW78654.1 single-stranded-DNA-specific exonuclease RecJ [Cohaesibacter celericrescens]
MISNSSHSKAYLGVTRSAKERRWIEQLDVRGVELAGAIAQSQGIPDLVARVLVARGQDMDTAEDYLDPSLKRLMPDPSTMTDMDKAAERIVSAIVKGEKIAVFGDYDVDGATSSALMTLFLRHCGCEANIYIPDRIFEGYGPNPDAIDQLIDQKHTLIITVDCGATSFAALEQAQARETDVVVLDHHQVGEELPPCVALVNPNRHDDLSQLGHLAAVGVTFMALVAVNRLLRKSDFYKKGKCTPPDLLAWLDLVALGTVCDVVPLQGLNRAFVVKGLMVIRAHRNLGMSALQTVSRVSGPVSPYHLGFMLGPRINAGGRIGDAALGARLLTCNDQEESEHLAAELERLNKERQALEQIMLEEATAQADRQVMEDPDCVALVTSSPDWHAGIVGLLASRLKERFRRPAFAIAINANHEGTGSGRSILGSDLGSAVRAACADKLLVKGGGHSMAAGLTILEKDIPAFRQFLNERLSEQVKEARALDDLKIDAALSATGATEELVNLLEKAGPFGAGNPEPVFVFPAHKIAFADVVGQGGHIRCTISNNSGGKLKGICFRAADEPIGKLLLDHRGQSLHIAGTLSLDHWQGRPTVQLRIIDAAEVTA